MVARLFDELPVDYERGLLDKRKCWTGFTYRLDTLTDIRRVRRSNITAFSRVTRRFNMPVRSSGSSVLRWPDRSQVAATDDAKALEIADPPTLPHEREGFTTLKPG